MKTVPAPLEGLVTWPQLDHWCRRGWLQPGQAGPRKSRVWSDHEVAVAHQMALMVDAGYQHEAAARKARDMVEDR